MIRKLSANHHFPITLHLITSRVIASTVSYWELWQWRTIKHCSLHLRQILPGVLWNGRISEWPVSTSSSLSMRALSLWISGPISGAHESLLQNRTPLLAVVLYCSYQLMTLSMHSLTLKRLTKPLSDTGANWQHCADSCFKCTLLTKLSPNSKSHAGRTERWAARRTSSQRWCCCR